tara:strand:+ start:1553 stop:3796 length:2244 start_codon:yes stop_codon:yes gene_type:complete
MAKLGDLIVNIGANTKGLNRELGKARREMKRFGSNFKSLGQDLTRSVSLPLLAIGAAAVKSASDLETLETSFISLTGGTKQAADMMKQLNEFTAKTPFQIDAVANSARQLIASGTEISQVNNQLQFLGDIAATSGSSIDEIAAIFSKVQAKGKVELESLNQLAERGIPIFTALSEATGLPASELGAGRVSVEQFNEVLKSFAQEGGFAAGAMERLSETAAGKFSTALDNLKLAGSELVESLMPALKGVIDFITDLAQKFIALDSGTKRIILVIGGLVATIGPLLIVIPKLIAGFIAIRAAVVAFNLALMTNPITLAAVAIAGITAAVVGYNIATVEAVRQTKTWREELDHLTLAQQKQKIQVAMQEFDSGPLKEHLKELEELEAEYRKKQLISIGQQGGFVNRAEKTRMRGRIEMLKQITEEMLKEERRMQKELDRINGEIADSEKKNQRAKEDRAVNSIKNLRKNVTDTKNALEAAVIGSDEYTQSLEAWENAVTELDEATKIFNKTNEEGKDSFPVNSLGALREKLSGLRAELDVLVPGTQAFVDKMAEIDGVADQVESATERIDSSLENTANSLENFATAIEGSLSAGAASMLSNIGAMIGGAQMGAAGILTPLADTAIRLGELAIGYGITIEGIKKALKSLSAPAAIAAGIALVALGTSLKNSIAAAAAEDLPELAAGGLAFGPTTAIVGDNKNAAIDPEVIAPLSKLKDLMGGEGTQVYGRISGDDIVISNRRAERDRNRFG